MVVDFDAKLTALEELRKQVEKAAQAKQPDITRDEILDALTLQQQVRKAFEDAEASSTPEDTDQDKLVYVNNVIKGKLLESAKLQQQAANNTKEQFANSPDLKTELLNAIMGALDAHTLMSTQALNSAAVQGRLKDILLNHAGLYETLRQAQDVAVAP